MRAELRSRIRRGSLLVVAVIALLPSVARSQSLPNIGPGWGLGLSVGRSPWNLSNAGRMVTLNSAADLSPVPSEVRYFDADRSTVTTLGVFAIHVDEQGVGQVSWVPSFFAETDYLSNSDFVPSVLGGASGTLSYGVSEKVSIGIGAALHATFMWGKIGEVGSASGDVVLTAPDGQDYLAGSEIWISGLRWGGDLFGALTVRGETAGMRIEAGYRFSGVPEWTYQVREVNGSERSSGLPADGFSGGPPDLKVNGLSLRLAWFKLL